MGLRVIDRLFRRMRKQAAIPHERAHPDIRDSNRERAATASRPAKSRTLFSDPEVERRCRALSAEHGVPEYVPSLWIVHMDLLYKAMVRDGIFEKSQTEDEWILRRLEEFSCTTLEDVKHAHNQLARKLGLFDWEID